ncbi:hypothetical protein [Streptomyces sp. Root369]|uniref:hypothetical protein n=1 Tax=Streptomyces sp. Root369 TaxID=1736523 RepID=UPI000712A189|nr:hypothetical protein [Streptomyces sp. Root369]KQW13576.1 hypothetical protein ASD08_30905 [Streptomyces sp. Root369]
MTLTSKVLAAVFGLAFVAAVSKGGQLVDGASWEHAAAAYGVAGLCLIGLLRELSRRLPPPGDYTDDIDAPAIKEAGPRARLIARREANRLLRRMPCVCERYWTSAGAQHDPWCPQFYRSAA